jgi:hypothetical protein
MIVNRQPFLLSDSMTYIRGADAAVFKSLDIATDWTERYRERFEEPQSTAFPRQVTEPAKPVILADRSIYYGAFLYLADRVAGLTLAVVAQAILAVTCLLFTTMRFCRMPASRAAKLLLLMTILLSIGSSFPFFTSFLEPDLLCGLALLAAAHLLTIRPILGKGEVYFWFALLSVCALMNSSTIVILIVVAVVAMIGSLAKKWVNPRGVALLVATILIGMAGEGLFEGVVLRQFGAPPVRPPFLMARLIADGPGRAYLLEHCPQAGFTLCRHLQSFSSYDSSADSDSFLWSHDIGNGVFSAVDPDERRRISDEEPRFVIAVLEDHPMAVLKSSALAVMNQSTKWGLSEFNVLPQQRQEFAEGLPPRVWKQQDKTLAFREAMPVLFTQALAFPLALLSFAIVLASALRSRPRDDDLKAFYLWLLIGLAADIVICGAISTPHDRYLMRVSWLIPMAGLLAVMTWKGTPFGLALAARNKSKVPVREEPDDNERAR